MPSRHGNILEEEKRKERAMLLRGGTLDGMTDFGWKSRMTGIGDAEEEAVWKEENVAQLDLSCR